MYFGRFLLLLSAVSTLGINSVYAAQIHVEPIQALSTDQYLALSQMKYSAEGKVDGVGATLKIAYSSSNDLYGYVAIMNDEGVYNPADMYSFLLPADASGIAFVNLSALTTWTPADHHYFLSFLSSNPHTDAQFTEMAIEPAGFFHTLSAAVHHLWSIEPYWVSTMHMLHGYRILGQDFSVILGCFLLVAVCVVISIKQAAGFSLAFGILLSGFLFYTLRFDADLMRMSVGQLHEWMTVHSYAQAGDTYSVADAIKKEASASGKPAAVSVCFDSTDYYAKLIRYLVYPLPVTMSGTILPQTTQVVVTRSLHYKEEDGILHCGGIDHAVTKIQSFPDGTILYSIPRS